MEPSSPLVGFPSPIGRIRGVGIDIEDIGRFRLLPIGQNQSFYARIFTPAEQAYCLARAEPYRHFTARFCAKEAYRKASGDNAPFNQVEILSEGGAPSIVRPGVRVHVSLSHDSEKAIAVVVVEDA